MLRYESIAVSPLEPSTTRPGSDTKVSQMDLPRPSAVVDPSTW